MTLILLWAFLYAFETDCGLYTFALSLSYCQLNLARSEALHVLDLETWTCAFAFLAIALADGNSSLDCSSLCAVNVPLLEASLS